MLLGAPLVVGEKSLVFVGDSGRPGAGGGKSSTGAGAVPFVAGEGTSALSSKLALGAGVAFFLPLGFAAGFLGGGGLLAAAFLVGAGFLLSPVSHFVPFRAFNFIAGRDWGKRISIRTGAAGAAGAVVGAVLGAAADDSVDIGAIGAAFIEAVTGCCAGADGGAGGASVCAGFMPSWPGGIFSWLGSGVLRW